jgi:hypothetical protein
LGLRRGYFVLLAVCLISLASDLHAHSVRRHPRRRAHHVHRSHRANHRHVRRAIWNPLFRGSHEMLVRQNEVINDLALPRIANDEELMALEEAEELVPVESSRQLAISIATPNRRFARPWTRDFLEDFGEAFYEHFHRPIQVTSLVRTVEQQKKLRRRNRNAGPEEGETASTHLTGATVDIYKRGLTRAQHKWIEAYLLPLKEQGYIDPVEERRQPVFHIMVFDSYPEPADDTEEPAASKDPGPMTILVTSKNLGIRFSLPDSWKDKYRVEEDSDYICVYFKPSVPVDEDLWDGLLFTIEKKVPDEEGEGFDDYKEFRIKGVTYLCGGPTDVTYEGPEDKTFSSMNADRSAVYATIRGL